MAIPSFPKVWLQFAHINAQAIPTVDTESYPPASMRFKALELVSPDEVNIVILGQDPYHGEGEAHGLAFSVPHGVPIPPSLRNIFQEISTDLAIPIPKDTDLTRWAKQGVLLLNTALSVAPNQAGSHSKKGWEPITDAIVHALGTSSSRPRVFILWGKPAQKKKPLIDAQRHLIIESAHPSPLSAYRGFWGSRPFSTANAWLSKQGLKTIDWR